ncbi:hypothetical protein D3C75_956920 [compost metagenome]
MNILDCRHLIAIREGYMIEHHFSPDLRGFERPGIVFILHINPLVKDFKHTFSRSFGLRIVVNMEAKPPDRANDVPDQTEESNQLTERHLFVDD